MKSELIPLTANNFSTFAQRTPKQCCSCALALAIMLGLAAVPPSAQAQTLTVLYSFKGGADGANPSGGLVRDSRGNFYGTTYSGGNLTCGSGCGTVFKLDTTGKETVLHTFTGGADGANPQGGVIRDAAGNLYGTTYIGGDLTCGARGCGTVFKLDTRGKGTVLHSFAGTPDGASPLGDLIRDAAGNLYGTSYIGGSLACGAQGCGTVFELDAHGKETVLHSFAGGPDGSFPYAGVIRDAAGNLFGTTLFGGVFNGGTVFKLGSASKETVLDNFTGGADGGTPYGGLVPDGAALYGTTSNGGATQNGTVFKLDKASMESVVYSFTGVDGSAPVVGVNHDAGGNLYGTTLNGGSFGSGTVFKLDSTGKETVLHHFTDGADGGFPDGGLIRDAAGNLYGTTNSGGTQGFGAIFKLTP